MFQREEDDIGKLEDASELRLPPGDNSDSSQDGDDGDRIPTVKEDKELARMMENIDTVPARQLRKALTLARSKTL